MDQRDEMHHAHRALNAKVDAECDKQATAVSLSLTTLIHAASSERNQRRGIGGKTHLPRWVRRRRTWWPQCYWRSTCSCRRRSCRQSWWPDDSRRRPWHVLDHWLPIRSDSATCNINQPSSSHAQITASRFIQPVLDHSVSGSGHVTY